MKKYILNTIFPMLLVLTCGAHAAQYSGFEKIKSLVGSWQGTLPDGKPIDISYREINGGAIVEIYHSKDPMWWNMSSVYHAGADRIIMNHYCSWGNHPRMTARFEPAQKDRLKFRFLDMTTTASENGYMHDNTIYFEDDNHISHHWIWREKGKDTPLVLKLERK